MKPTYIVFLDAIGRTIIGTFVSETETQISVKNPAVVHAQADRTSGRLSLQTLPIFFKEFQADKEEATIWNYNKAVITVAQSFVLDSRFEAQYEALFKLAEKPAETATPKIIKLED